MSHESEYSKFLESMGIDKEKMLADMESRLSECEKRRMCKMRNKAGKNGSFLNSEVEK